MTEQRKEPMKGNIFLEKVISGVTEKCFPKEKKIPQKGKNCPSFMRGFYLLYNNPNS